MNPWQRISITINMPTVHAYIYVYIISYTLILLDTHMQTDIHVHYYVHGLNAGYRCC